MNKPILVTYKSVTGFTEQYAKWIAEELDCALLDIKEVSPQTMSAYKTVIFGGRFHAGFVDGLKKAKKRFEKSGAAKLIVFATGAAPGSAEDLIEEAWKNNFTPEELAHYPHFYMPGGLRYEKMPLGDRLMMKVFAAMVRGKKEKSEYERAMMEALDGSYDLSARKNIEELVGYVRNDPEQKTVDQSDAP